MATAYVEIDKLRSYVGIGSNSYDTLLEEIELEAAKQVENKLGFEILEKVDQIFTFDKFDKSIILPVFPIRNVSIEINGSAYASFDFNGNNGIVYNLGSCQDYRRKIKVTCTYGYEKTTIPEPIRLAIKMLVRLNWFERPDGKDMFAKDQVDNGEGAPAFSIDRSAVHKEVNRLLKPFKASLL